MQPAVQGATQIPCLWISEVNKLPALMEADGLDYALADPLFSESNS